jgi:hypothetical protein
MKYQPPYTITPAIVHLFAEISETICRYTVLAEQNLTLRLHREHADKQDVRIYDYVETDKPQLARMWDKRQRGYRAMGYEIKPMESVILGKGENLK